MTRPPSPARCGDRLRIDLPDRAYGEVAESCRFDTVKKNADRITGEMDWGFKGGNQTFFHKGTNGRWQGVLSEDELALYDRAMQKLPPDLARWLETGGPLPAA